MDFIKKCKSPENLCFITTFLIGFATHLFGFVNVIHNYDDVGAAPIGSGVGLSSGRWLLDILDTLGRIINVTYNLPYVNSIIFLFLIALTVKYMIRTLGIRNSVYAILIGAVFVVFPSATSILFFKFTAVLYGLSVLFAVLAVWCVRQHKYGFIPSIFLIACSLGIYQAFVPITISLMVILLLKDTLGTENNAMDTILEGLKYAITLILGVVTYYVLLKICLLLNNVQLSDYQGINEMGNIQLIQLPTLLIKTFRGFISILFGDYMGISQTELIRFGILLLGCVSAILIVFLLIAHRKKWDSILLTILLCCVFPIAVNFIVIMAPKGYVYTLMIYSFATIFTVPFVLLELMGPLNFSGKYFSFAKKYIQKAASVGIIIILLSYAYWANVNYTDLYFTTEKAKAYMSALVVQARMTDGFDTSMRWAFVGKYIQDPLMYERWYWVPKFGGNERTTSLINAHSRMDWIKSYFGYNIPLVGQEQLAELEQNPDVIAMPCFPNDGSIKIINNTLVIKLENEG